jgi:hypothetical protein
MNVAEISFGLVLVWFSLVLFLNLCYLNITITDPAYLRIWDGTIQMPIILEYIFRGVLLNG